MDVQNNPAVGSSGPLKTDRALWKIIVFSLLTFGIYGIVFFTGAANALNTAAGNRNGKKTMHYCLLVFVIAPLTLGIGLIVWMHKFSARLGNELKRRGIPMEFGADTYWLWGVLGGFILVGPFIYLHKLCNALNAVCADYNARG